MLVGLSALSWVILIPSTLCWPIVGYFGYRIFKSAKRHGDADRLERERLLALAEKR